jgi:hypothetical protein
MTLQRKLTLVSHTNTQNREHGIAPDGTMISKEPSHDKSYQTFYRTLLV